MSAHLLAAFPGLAVSPFRVTSPADTLYNCIAWAAGQPAQWWWPTSLPGKAVWPPGVPRVRTLDAFRAAFATIGYIDAADESLEAGHEKVAIFADAAGLPTHAARQLPTGRWTSKLGTAEDIEHDLRALEGHVYGTVVLILKRATN